MQQHPLLPCAQTAWLAAAHHLQSPPVLGAARDIVADGIDNDSLLRPHDDLHSGRGR